MNAPFRTVHVALAERSYDIEIGSGALETVGEQLQGCCPAKRVVVITDENIQHTHAELAVQSIAEQCDAIELLVVEPGETTKSLESVEAILEKMLDLGADRKTAIVACGGGVVGDLAGFVAAIYARGLPFFQVPTTLLAQVDSSVGGKTGVNLPAAKNMVGAFWQPRGVCIDIDVLATLPEREYRAGLAEVVKYGVILDAAFFAWLEVNIEPLQKREPAALTHVVARSCELKAEVVTKDEREETGLRAVLNYGHTFAHAFEALAGYGELLHGEAVAVGMECAARLARSLGRVDEQFVARQSALIAALELAPPLPSLDPSAILAAMQHDKKTEHGRLRFVLPTRLGHVELVKDVPADQVVAALI